MGKKQRAKNKKVSACGKPLVSICTPTYNRRIFIPTQIKNYLAQTYPQQLMEWIIIDDGEDSVEDLFKDLPTVKYFRVEEKSDVLGCVSKRRKVWKEHQDVDYYIWLDTDIIFDERTLAYIDSSIQ